MIFALSWNRQTGKDVFWKMLGNDRVEEEVVRELFKDNTSKKEVSTFLQSMGHYLRKSVRH